MRKSWIWITLGTLAILSGAAGAVYSRWWIPNQRFEDHEWYEAASAEERRAVCRQVLLAPLGNDHDAFIELGYVGTVEEVPALLKGLSRFSDGDEECTRAHALEALRKVTGHDCGHRFRDWAEWWEKTGSRLPPSSFPLKDWIPPKKKVKSP